MELLIVALVIIGIGCWMYRSGKRAGSRKAYGVGFCRGRCRQQQMRGTNAGVVNAYPGSPAFCIAAGCRRSLGGKVFPCVPSPTTSCALIRL